MTVVHNIARVEWTIVVVFDHVHPEFMGLAVVWAHGLVVSGPPRPFCMLTLGHDDVGDLREFIYSEKQRCKNFSGWE